MMSTRPPFSPDWRKSYHRSLAVALSTAWRKYKREWSVDNISHEQKVVFDGEGLMQVFSRMDEIMRGTPTLSLDEVSERIVRGIEKDVSE
jgi:hypothetical protein